MSYHNRRHANCKSQSRTAQRRLVIESLDPRALLAGDLDTTFGLNGKVVTPFFNQEFGTEGASTVAKQSSGKLILGGGVDVVVRVSADGTIDSSFGDSGKALVRGGVNDIAVDSQDRIIAVGQVNDEFRDFARIVRLLPNGSRDATFGTDGLVLSRIGNVSDQAVSVVVQSDGKILVGIRTNSGTDNSFGFNLDFGVERYNSDGSLDTTFGTNGRVVTSLGGNADTINKLLVQPDGGILAIGRAGSGSIQHSMNTALVRYLPNGALDPTFDGDGIQVINLSLSNSDDGATTAELQTDGKIVIGGSANNRTNTDFLLARFNADGSPDATFNPAGPRVGAKEFTFGAGFDSIQDIEVRPNGQYWVLGTGTNTFSSNQFSVLMLVNPNGFLDTSYDSDGWLSFSYPDFVGATSARITIGPNDSITGIGVTQTQVPLTPNSFTVNSDFALVGFTPQGLVDTSFGTGGYARIDCKLGTSTTARAALQDDGKLLVLGTTTAGFSKSLSSTFEYQWALARYNTDGNLDSSFGVNGRTVLKFPNGLNTEASDLLIQPDGKIVAFGLMLGTFTVARFQSNGSLDLQFGNQGYISQDFGTARDAPGGIALRPDGKIVMVGFKQDYNSNFSSFLPGSAVVAQLNADGTIDSSFGTAGKVIFGIGSIGTYATSVQIQSDNKIVVGGYTEPTSPRSFAARLLADGSFDPSFGTAGISTFGINNVQFVNDLKIQADGKIVLGGVAGINTKFNTTITRLLPDGTLDSTFSSGGIRSFLIGNNDSFGGLVIQPNGRIVVTTRSDVFPNPLDSTEYYEIGVARLSPDGSFDPTFDGDGKRTLPFGPGSEVGRDVLLQTDGKIILVGDNYYPTSRFDSVPGDILVARLNNSNLTISSPTIEADEGALAVNTGTWTDLSNISASIGTIQKNADGTWTWQLLTSDGPIDSQTVTITATDSSGIVAEKTFSLTVKNIAPTATLNGSSSVAYGGAPTFTLSNPFDPSSVDQASLHYSFALSQSDLGTYSTSDTNPSYQFSTSLGVGSYTVYGRIMDKDGGSTDYQRVITVTPASLSVSANSQSKIFGSADPVLTYTVSGFQFNDTAATVLSGALTRAAGENVGNYAITQGTLAANSNYAVVFTGNTFSITPVNTVATVTLTNAPPVSVPGLDVTFTASVSSVAGTPTGTVTFKDGVTVLGVISLVNGLASLTTNSLSLGSHTITATYSGDANYIASAPVSVVQVVRNAITVPDPQNPGQSILYIGGTNNHDEIEVEQEGNRYEVEVESGDGCDEYEWEGSFAGPVSRIVIFGLNGNDEIDAEDVSVPVWVTAGSGNNDIQTGSGNDIITTGNGNNTIQTNAGNDLVTTGSGTDDIDAGNGDDLVRSGAGNDTLQGGNGNDILLGEAGNDTLFGNSGRDLLIGGIGADRLNGNNDDDLLIAGYTFYDANDFALKAVLREWSSNNSYNTRVANITNGTGLSTGFKLIGADGATQTVFNDNDSDVLTGSSGQDWFFANQFADNGGAIDIVTDKAANEWWNDTDF